MFPIAERLLEKSPEATAQEVGEYLKANCKAIADFNVVKGFLNLVIAPAAWIGLLNDIQRPTRSSVKSK